MQNSDLVRLVSDADLDHEDARGWYEAYGWHITTEQEGDVTLVAVEYDWLDGADGEAAAKLCESHDGLLGDEAESIVAKAREVREAAEAVEGLLAEAVEAYRRQDLDGVMSALDRAERVESEHGDYPAAKALRSQLLELTESAEAEWDAEQQHYQLWLGEASYYSDDGDDWIDVMTEKPASSLAFKRTQITLVGGPRDGVTAG